MNRLIDSALKRLLDGRAVDVVYASGTRKTYGRQPHSGIAVTLKDMATEARIARDPDLAVGEAYMDGSLTIDGGTLYGLLNILIEGLGRLREPVGAKLLQTVRMATRRLAQANHPFSSRKNVAAHYDLKYDFYRKWLDPDMQYSCAYFESTETSLEEAQRRKKERLLHKLMLSPGQKVLDIGCGWGGLGLTLARDGGADVIGVTLSEEQLEVARRRQRETNLPVEFRLQDYRHVTESFDRIVSVGMFEHVGVGYYRTFFNKVATLLNERGVALLHTIGRTTPPGFTNPFIQKYIFPGGYIPALSEVVEPIEQEGLVITDVEIMRLHYAETLKHWRERFLAIRDDVVAMYDERFTRMWEFYLASCEASFRHNDLVVFQIQMTKRLDTLPMTRQYMEHRPNA